MKCKHKWKNLKDLDGKDGQWDWCKLCGVVRRKDVKRKQRYQKPQYRQEK